MRKKVKMIFSGLIPLFLALVFPGKINAATNSYRPSTAEVTDTQDVYTLPPQPACESSKGAGQDRQPLGYILQPGGSITITNNSDIILLRSDGLVSVDPNANIIWDFNNQ